MGRDLHRYGQGHTQTRILVEGLKCGLSWGAHTETLKDTHAGRTTGVHKTDTHTQAFSGRREAGSGASVGRWGPGSHGHTAGL